MSGVLVVAWIVQSISDSPPQELEGVYLYMAPSARCYTLVTIDAAFGSSY